jgi:thiol-disulfide isomerase/thioredoxin
MKKRKQKSKDNFIKKVSIVFAALLGIMTVTVVILNQTSDTLDYKSFQAVDSYEKVNEIEDQKFSLYFYSESCGACQSIKNTSLSFFDDNRDNLPVYMLDASTIRGSRDSLDLPQGESLTSTPTLMIVEYGVIVQFLVGTVEIQDYIDNY